MLPTLKNSRRVLRSIFLSNWYRLCGKLNFPVSIIPRICYLSKIDIHALLESQTVYVIRRSDAACADTFNDMGKIREDALQPKEIPFMSLNLLGGYFKPEHTCFKIIGNGSKKWINNEYVFISEHIDDYEVLKNYCIVYFDANLMHNQSIPYSQPTKSKELNLEIEKFFAHISKPIIKDGEHQLEGFAKVVHDPTKLNYWHLEYNLCNFKGDPIKYTGSKSIEKYCKKVINDILCANSFDKLDPIPPIPKQHYLR